MFRGLPAGASAGRSRGAPGGVTRTGQVWAEPTWVNNLGRLTGLLREPPATESVLLVRWVQRRWGIAALSRPYFVGEASRRMGDG